MNFLLKNKYLLLNYFEKNDKLNLESKDLRKGFGGRLLTVNWRTEFTKFDIYDYVKISKKQRSHEIEKKEKEVLNYNFTGICISYKKDFFSLNTSFVIRNVFDSFPLEMTFPLYSPQISAISVILFQLKMNKLSSNRLYYLRKKKIPMSQVNFHYVFN